MINLVAKVLDLILPKRAANWWIVRAVVRAQMRDWIKTETAKQ